MLVSNSHCCNSYEHVIIFVPKLWDCNPTIAAQASIYQL